ncbi:hypothetical protein POJ06DRAFT_150501 [Lipomyces tetrasporus]|uniref:Uncharacterized protein n=1 Tax=Lipomyces tetrasporus TaxID=54092 RepID=A0AAD7QN19_9ASCO|nr:uncharacterized protein POJ06DRAFT_150501 [Lipomyces tetrasporus]KAJ8098382.1 hypothetical protein POJ06DRAFT_150501 [Lipomyces tetrasporus]
MSSHGQTPQLPDPPKRKRGRPPKNPAAAIPSPAPEDVELKQEDVSDLTSESVTIEPQVLVEEDNEKGTTSEEKKDGGNDEEEETAQASADDDDEDEDEEEEEEDDDDEDAEIEEDEDDEDEYEGSARKSSRRNLIRVAGRKKEDDEDDKGGEDKRVKRGRPPTVDKPHESRIKIIMRALRKAKTAMRFLYLPFERLPDKGQYPEYYREIKDPIALDMIRKKIKRRLYPDVESFLQDLRLMFDNAKEFNSPNSILYKDTVTLQKLVNSVAAEEMSKPDSTFQDPESSSLKHARIPLDGIEHNGEYYRVGDWVHISSLNDPKRPTIGQIFRTWQAPDGRKWINACWYYRPEQTVHRYDKYFYENEVVKSGQYRDHLIDEVLEKCFVMFFTKYQRGRPVGFEDKAVYCCESRYNENEKTFNKIRTWKACIPDEVRSTDYEMVLFEKPQPLRKVPSPIKHLLPPDAKDDDPVPEPKVGAENAPPIIGAVYKRPPDPSAKEPSPSPDPPAPAPPSNTAPSSDVNSPFIRNSSVPRSSVERTLSSNKQIPRPELGRFTSGMSTPGTPTPPSMNYNYNPPMTPLGYGSPGQMAPMNRPMMYNPPPPPSTFTLPDYITDRIPPETAELYQKDDNGKLLWFSVPPVDSSQVGVETASNGKGILGHSVEFLSRRKEIAEKRERRAEEREQLFSKKAKS